MAEHTSRRAAESNRLKTQRHVVICTKLGDKV